MNEWANNFVSHVSRQNCSTQVTHAEAVMVSAADSATAAGPAYTHFHFTFSRVIKQEPTCCFHQDLHTFDSHDKRQRERLEFARYVETRDIIHKHEG